MDQATRPRHLIAELPATRPPDVRYRRLGPLAQALATARFNRRELAGSLGDMGTFLPLLLGMVAQNGLSFVSALFFAGLFSLVTGLLFAIPMAVQPMKAIAAVALAQNLTAPQIVAAGATVSAVVLL